MKVKLLNQTHPDYDADSLARHLALYHGGKRWRELVGWWLPRNDSEMPEVYADRQKRATYENHVGPICDRIGAHLFSEPPAVEGLEGDWVGSFLANVDRENHGIGSWFKERFVEALVARRAFVWVNLPARDPDVVIENRQVEEELGLLDAYLVSIDAEQVLDWGVDPHGRLNWLLFRDVTERREAPDTPRLTVWRWTAITRDAIRRWEWRPPEDEPTAQPKDEAEAIELEPIIHGLGELPIACLELPDGLWAMGKLHDPAVSHLRGRNDLTWALHRAAHALLYIKSKWDDERPILGAGYFVRLGEKDEIGYAEPSGTNFELLAKDVQDRREAMYRVVGQLAVGADSNATRSRMSGESKASDWRAMEILLAAYADLVGPWVREVMRLVAKARGMGDVEVAVKGLDGWQSEDLAAWLDAAAMATDAHRFSPTFQRTVAKRQAERVLEGADPEALQAIHKEIDEADIDPAPYVPPPLPGPGNLPPEDEDDSDEDDEGDDDEG